MEVKNENTTPKTIPNDVDKEQKGINVPNLRFNEEKWISVKNHQLFSIASEKNKNNLVINVLSASQEKGMIPRNEIGIDISFDKNSISNYKIVNIGDYVVHLRSFQGGFAFSKQEGICSPAYTILRPNLKYLNNSFFESYFTSQKFINSLKLVTYGIRDGRSIAVDEWLNMSTYIPSREIQDKIINFIENLNLRINTQSKIIEDLDTLKNSIMDQLLMRNIFDEISIKDFINQGYARIIKASEMKKFSGEKLYLSTSSINKNGIFKIECKITYNDRPSRASMIPIKNSVWFAKMKDSIKVYKSENDDESKYVLSTGFYGILCDEDVVNPDWMVEIFKSNYFNNQKDRFSEGSSMSGIKENQLEDIKVKLFKNKNLEKKYCQLFYILNKKLNVETDYLEKLKEQKKYLLSNMFI